MIAALKPVCTFDALSQPRPGGALAPVVREGLDRAAAPQAGPNGVRKGSDPLPSGERFLFRWQPERNSEFNSRFMSRFHFVGQRPTDRHAHDLNTGPSIDSFNFFGSDCNIEIDRHDERLVLVDNAQKVTGAANSFEFLMAQCWIDGGGSLALVIFKVFNAANDLVECCSYKRFKLNHGAYSLYLDGAS